MPELPEVEVLVRHLGPILRNKTIRAVEVRRARVLRPTSLRTFKRTLIGASFSGVSRRGKYLVFEIRVASRANPVTMLGHLGMTGRMYLLPSAQTLPKHAAVVMKLDEEQFIFEDTRYFGRLTLDVTGLKHLGPEPLSRDFTRERLHDGVKRSSQPIKVKLLDQTLVAGIGNIYASEALFRAGISPKMEARRLNTALVGKLRTAIRRTLAKAIQLGSTVPLNYTGDGERDGLFYYGLAPSQSEQYEERLTVYDRQGQPCFKCGTKIKRIVQAARSTFYCPHCQRR